MMSAEADYYGEDAFHPGFQPARPRNSIIARKPVSGPSTVAHHGHQVPPPSTSNEQNEDRITPAPPQPMTQAEFEAITTPGGSQPFMHYEDYSYFETEPKGDHAAHERETDTLSLPEPRRTERPSRARRKRGQRLPWLAEILWLLLSVACLVVIVVILWKYDEKPLRHCPKDISLNTFVAFFLAMCQASFILPVVEGLSQLKWNWYARAKRPLTDFQVFEDATRGLDGSLRLLVSTQGRILSKVAAVVLLTSLVTSPLTQAVIDYSSYPSPGDGTAAMPISEVYPKPDASESSDGLDISHKQAVQQGIYSPISEPVSDISPTCSSGDCRWDSFQSLGVCVETNDVTDYLLISGLIDADSLDLNLPAKTQVRNASLSNGAYLLGGPNTYNLNITFPYPATTVTTQSSDPRDKTLSFIEQPDLLDAAIADFFVIYTNSTTVPVAAPFRAVEVLMHFCINTYSATVVQGIAQTTRLSSDTNVTKAGDDGNRSSSADLLSIVGDSSNFTVNSTYALLLSEYLSQSLSGTYSLRLGDQTVGMTGASDASGAALFLGDLVKRLTESNNDALRHQAIKNITENVAISLSNAIRGLGTTVIGTVYITETHLCVQWAWLACVAAQIMMSAIFVLGVMIQTSVWKVKVVKSSALANMLAINANDKGRLERENLGQVTDIRTMSTRLRSTEARFAVQEDGYWSLNFDLDH